MGDRGGGAMAPPINGTFLPNDLMTMQGGAVTYTPSTKDGNWTTLCEIPAQARAVAYGASLGRAPTAQGLSTNPSTCLGQNTLMLQRPGTRTGCPRHPTASRMAVWLLRPMLATARTSLTTTSGLASRLVVQAPWPPQAQKATRPTNRFSRRRPPTGLL